MPKDPTTTDESPSVQSGEFATQTADTETADAQAAEEELVDTPEVDLDECPEGFEYIDHAFRPKTVNLLI